MLPTFIKGIKNNATALLFWKTGGKNGDWGARS